MPEIRNMNLTQGQKEFDRRQKNSLTLSYFERANESLDVKNKVIQEIRTKEIDY